MQHCYFTSTLWRLGGFLLGITLAGCAPRVPASVSPDYGQHKPTTIAVLPVHNQTGQPLDAPASHAYLKALLERAFVPRDEVTSDVSLAWRRKIANTLQRKSYRIVPLAPVEEKAVPSPLTVPPPGADGVLYSSITAWDTRQLKTANTIFVAASFALVDVATHQVLWEAEWPYARVSVRAAQPWHDIRYYIARVVEETFATLP